MPAAFAAFWYTRQTWSYDHGSLPSWTGEANIQSSDSENRVACFQLCNVAHCETSFALSRRPSYSKQYARCWNLLKTKL